LRLIEVGEMELSKKCFSFLEKPFPGHLIEAESG
jgi:hypothetical protein